MLLEWSLVEQAVHVKEGAGGNLTLIIHINWTDLPSSNEPCKYHNIAKEAGLKNNLLFALACVKS